MGKLRDDEIKFILNLEAKGLQAEIGKSSAAVKKRLLRRIKLSRQRWTLLTNI